MIQPPIEVHIPTPLQIAEHDLYQLRRAVREYLNHSCLNCEAEEICNIRDAMRDLLEELTEKS